MAMLGCTESPPPSNSGWSPLKYQSKSGPTWSSSSAMKPSTETTACITTVLIAAPSEARSPSGAPAKRPPASVVPTTLTLEVAMSYVVDFTDVSTIGLESSPVAKALAGVRANEARYFQNKYSHTFTVEPASDAMEVVEYVHHILAEERDIVIASRPLEAT